MHNIDIISNRYYLKYNSSNFFFYSQAIWAKKNNLIFENVMRYFLKGFFLPKPEDKDPEPKACLEPTFIELEF